MKTKRDGLTKIDREVLARAIACARRHWDGERQNWQVIATSPVGNWAFDPEQGAWEAKRLARLIAKLDVAAAKL
jgi:hypothetical protein